MKEKGLFRRKRVRFAQVSNHCLQNPNISLAAKGLYSLIQSLITSDEYVVYKTVLQRDFCKEGERAFDSAWNELKKAGYLLAYKINTPKGFVYEYELLDDPEMDSAPTEKGGSDSLSSEINSLKNRTGCSNSPDPHFAPLGNPGLGFPQLENEGANNTYRCNTYEYNTNESNNNVVVDNVSKETDPQEEKAEDCFAVVSDSNFDPAMFDCHDEPDQEYIQKHVNAWASEQDVIEGWQARQRMENIFDSRFHLPKISDKVFALKAKQLDSLHGFDDEELARWNSAKKLLLTVFKTFRSADDISRINNATFSQIERAGEVAYKLVAGEIAYNSQTGYLASSIRRIFGLE